VLDYDREADHYDESRGGDARAAAAAEAVERLLPEATQMLVDVGCGTGIVTTRLRRPMRTVMGVDRSPGMIAKASGRLPCGAVLGDATRLPLKSAHADAVVLIWLLHLLPDAAPVIAEAARVLSRDGVLITTVDKDEAAFGMASDVASVTAPMRRSYAPQRADERRRVLALAAQHGLRPIAETSFTGLGQGRTPRQWRDRILAGVIPWSRRALSQEVADICRALASLPSQDTPRPDPLYRLVALSR
jgi:SAM-dependent methyltransferase